MMVAIGVALALVHIVAATVVVLHTRAATAAIRHDLNGQADVIARRVAAEWEAEREGRRLGSPRVQ